MKKKQNVYIIGAGGFGREIESWVNLSNDFNRHYSLKGYLDDNPDALNGYPTEYKILASVNEFHFEDSDRVLIGIGDPGIKENIFLRLKNRVSFLTFIFDSTIVSRYVKIGEGTIVAPNCVLCTNCQIGQLVTINLGTHLGHDTIISDFSSIMANVDISGNVKIGKSVFVGSNTTLVPGKHVGDNTMISAGSIVISDLPKFSFAFGNPAKIIQGHYEP